MKPDVNKRRVVRAALFSRVIVIILQYIFNQVIPDHDAGVFMYSEEPSISLGDKLIKHLFGGFTRWDAQYFMHIAKYGYTYENTVAFFPLFPLLGNVIAKCVFLNDILNIESILLVTFIVLNTVVFLYSARTLYELSTLLMSKKMAYFSTLLFCWNPASIFFSALYTECLFSFLSFKSMFHSILLYKKYYGLQSRIIVQDILHLAPIALSGITRSNGVVNTGFFLYVLICKFLSIYTSINGNIFIRIGKKLSLIFAFTIITIFSIGFCLFLFDLFQIYCYSLFCTDFKTNLPVAIENYAAEHNLVLPGSFSKYNQSWCHDRLPLAYSYVQKHYWNVGFLKYYEFKQIPNFLLALPILTFFFYNCIKYLVKNPLTKIFDFNIFSTKQDSPFENTNLYVYIIHGLALSVFCLLFMHIQVSTRLLCSASPILYWFSAHYLTDDGKFCDIRNFKRLDLLKKYIILYYTTYFVVGIALFSNFLPWT